MSIFSRVPVIAERADKRILDKVTESALWGLQSVENPGWRPVPLLSWIRMTRSRRGLGIVRNINLERESQGEMGMPKNAFRTVSVELCANM